MRPKNDKLKKIVVIFLPGRELWERWGEWIIDTCWSIICSMHHSPHSLVRIIIIMLTRCTKIEGESKHERRRNLKQNDQIIRDEFIPGICYGHVLFIQCRREGPFLPWEIQLKNVLLLPISDYQCVFSAIWVNKARI